MKKNAIRLTATFGLVLSASLCALPDVWAWPLACAAFLPPSAPWDASLRGLDRGRRPHQNPRNPRGTTLEIDHTEQLEAAYAEQELMRALAEIVADHAHSNGANVEPFSVVVGRVVELPSGEPMLRRPFVPGRTVSAIVNDAAVPHETKEEIVALYRTRLGLLVDALEALAAQGFDVRLERSGALVSFALSVWIFDQPILIDPSNVIVEPWTLAMSIVEPGG